MDEEMDDLNDSEDDNSEEAFVYGGLSEEDKDGTTEKD